MRLGFGAMTALALVLCAATALADDISNWSTIDDNNNRTPPKGWPSGTLLPSQVEPTGRAVMGAIARWYALMGGTNSAGVANTTAVRAATTASYPNGFMRLTDGTASAPPLRYIIDSNSACSADDGGSCIAASGGGYFIAQFPGNVADIREFGVVGDNTTDNSTALQNAFTWAAANNGTLYVPGKSFYAASGMSTTIPANGTLTVVGPGKLRFGASAANGLYFSVTGPYATVHLRDFTIQASGAMSTAAAINLHQNTVEGFPITAQTSDITNVTMLGSDGVGATNYWGYGIYNDFVSNISMVDDNYYGPAALNGDAIYLAGGGATNKIGIVYNISGFNAYALNVGIYYNSYIQGVTLTQSNFTACKTGAYIASATNTDQLTISDSQFACSKSAIDDEGGMFDLIVHHNLFIPLNAGANADVIHEVNPIGLQITNNVINGQNITDGFTYNAVAIAGGNSSSTGIITGNAIRNISDGIVLSSGAQGVRIADNQPYNVTTPYIIPAAPTSSPVSLTVTQIGITSVSNVGATGLSPNYVQLTVASTAGFYNGEWVCVSGTSGGSDPDANSCTTISITDGTHMVLQGVGSNGSSYSSGGFVSAIP